MCWLRAIPKGIEGRNGDFSPKALPGKGEGQSSLTQLMRTYLGRPELGSFTLQKAYITFPLLSSSTISSRPPSAPGEKGEAVRQEIMYTRWEWWLLPETTLQGEHSEHLHPQQTAW